MQLVKSGATEVDVLEAEPFELNLSGHGPRAFGLRQEKPDVNCLVFEDAPWRALRGPERSREPWRTWLAVNDCGHGARVPRFESNPEAAQPP